MTTMTINRPAPVETPEARKAIVEMYRALLVLDKGDLLDFIAESAFDPKAAEQCREAIASAEALMSPNLLLTVIETYTMVRFTLADVPGRTLEGQTREGAWGLYPDRGEQAITRRLTMTSGMEFFVTPETEFASFEVLSRGTRG